MSRQLPRDMQNALLRTTEPEKTAEAIARRRAFSQAALQRHHAAPAVHAAGGCARCNGCRYVTAYDPDRPGRIEEPWHVHAQLRAHASELERGAARPCPDCNPSGSLPFREPVSGAVDAGMRVH